MSRILKKTSQTTIELFLRIESFNLPKIIKSINKRIFKNKIYKKSPEFYGQTGAKTLLLP